MDLGRLLHFGVPPWELALRAVVIYFVLLAALRLFGKREVGQFTLFDLVLVLLVANAVQPAITGPDSSLAGGVVIIVSLVVANFLVAQLDRIPLLHRFFMLRPTELVRNGAYLTREMELEDIDKDEVEMAIREHGLDDVKQVKRAVLEADGSISIIGKDDSGRYRRRRRRYRRRT
jgi:uncharacterized membrane protein YcaP (DUF421 family)